MPGQHIALSSRVTSQRGEIIGTAPELRLTETDQTDPAGRSRLRVNDDVLYIDRAASANWVTASNLLQVSNTGVFTITQEDATANGIVTVLTLNKNTSGTPANNLGVGLDFGIETSTLESVFAASIDVSWTDITTASRDSTMAFSIVRAGSGTLVEALRLQASAGGVTPGRVAVNVNHLATMDFEVYADSTMPMLKVDGSANQLGIGTNLSGANEYAAFVFGDWNVSGVPGMNYPSHIQFGSGTAGYSQIFTDSVTAASGTTASHAFIVFFRPVLRATNTNVTTTDAATIRIANAPLADTNQTITNAWALWTGGAVKINDDLRLALGTDNDSVLYHRSTSLNANTALTGVLVGTPVTPVAPAANSLLIGNITASGDILIAVNKGGNSYMAFMADASTGDTLLGVPTGQSFDVYVAGVKEIDYSTGALAFQQATTISTTAGDLTLNPTADITIGAVGNQVNLKLLGGTSGVVTLAVAAVAGTYTLTLPIDDGIIGQYLQTDGTGVLTWATVTSLSLADDVFGTFGVVASLGWETADANANALLLALPVSDGTDIPALVIGDANLINVNLGLLDTFTFPSISVIDTDRDSALTLSYSADDVPIIASNRSIVLRPSGDLDDYFTFSTLTNVPTIFGTGAYTRFGDAAFTSRALASEDDVMISGVLEVDGAAHFDNLAYFHGAPRIDDNIFLVLGSGTDSRIRYSDWDANALSITFELPSTDANPSNVPVLVISDTLTNSLDMGLFDGLAQPLVALIEMADQLHTATNGIADAGAATAILKHVGGFTNAVVGDIVRITAGTNCTVGWYWITTVTSADQVTLDRNYTSGDTTNATFVTFHNFPMIGADGVCLKCFDGAPGDANVEIDRDGWLQLDVSQANGRLYWRANNAWHYVDATAGISMPKEERIDSSGHRFEIGDKVEFRVDRINDDGSFHAMPVFAS